MDEDRNKDKLTKLIPSPGTGQTHREVTLDVLKSAYIGEGLNAKELSERYFLSLNEVERVIKQHNLVDLRKAYIREGISKIQNEQLNQAQKLLDVELNFKKLRLAQLEKQLEDFVAYYARFGDFRKRHPVTGDILKDTDGIPMQIQVPNVSREINQLKESVTLSEGVKKLMTDLDSIINGAPQGEIADGNDSDIIDMTEIDGLFKKKV